MAETKTNGTGPGHPQPGKVEAVQQALKKLGRGAQAAQIQKYVKDALDMELSLAQVNGCLGMIRRGAGRPAARKPPKRNATTPPAPAGARSRPPAAARPAADIGISLEDIAAVQGLLGRVGPEKLRGLIDLLTR